VPDVSKQLFVLSPLMKGRIMTHRIAGKFLLSVCMVCVVSLSCQAGVILSENFDELTPQLSATSVGAFHTIGGTNVDIVGGSLFGFLCVAPTSGNCVDLGGSGGNSSGILQTVNSFTLQPGTKYFLSFDLIGSQRGPTTSTTVDFGPYSQTFVLASNDVTSGVVMNALVTVSSVTTTFLTFTDNSPTDGIGSLLDNVSITATAAPEPGTVGLLGIGLLGLGGMLRRRMNL
jgi:PEP-CTERM motif